MEVQCTDCKKQFCFSEMIDLLCEQCFDNKYGNKSKPKPLLEVRGRKLAFMDTAFLASEKHFYIGFYDWFSSRHKGKNLRFDLRVWEEGGE